jgi:hypothetical protein
MENLLADMLEWVILHLRVHSNTCCRLIPGAKLPLFPIHSWSSGFNTLQEPHLFPLVGYMVATVSPNVHEELARLSRLVILATYSC